VKSALAGARVAVTRSGAQAADLARLIVARGGAPVLVPCLRVVGPVDAGALDEALDRLPRDYDGVVFSSTNAVHWTLARTTSESFAGVRVVAVGAATAEALRERGVPVDVVPAAFHSEGILAALDEAGDLAGTRWLLPRADVAREVLPEGLEARGAQVDRVVAYRNAAPEPGAVERALEAGIDAITFASGSAVVRLREALGPRFEERLRGAVVASIGPVTSQACREAGLTVHAEAESAGIAALVDALADIWETRS
jgi:uroporphyrinogen-III synthase